MGITAENVAEKWNISREEQINRLKEIYVNWEDHVAGLDAIPETDLDNVVDDTFDFIAEGDNVGEKVLKWVDDEIKNSSNDNDDSNTGYHDVDFESYIKDNGTGSLVIAGDTIQIMNAAQTETMGLFQQDAATSIHYNNDPKLLTTATGVQVSGTAVTTAGITAGSHILPATDGDVDLGSSTKKFRDLHLSGSTLKIGTIQFKDSASGLRVEKITGNEVVPIVFRELEVDSATVSGNISAGTFTGDGNALTNFNAAQIRTHMSAGTGVGFASGVISIGQAVGTGNDVQFKDLLLTGDLTVQGTTTTISSATMDVTDKNITIAKGAADASAAEDAAIADVNGDGFLDVMVAAELSHLIYLQNPGSDVRSRPWDRVILPMTQGRGSYIRVFLADLIYQRFSALIL